MKRVGILTLSSAINYGATLQCFSLVSFFNEQNEVKAQIINYTPDFMIGRYKPFSISNTNLFSMLKSIIANSLEYRAKKNKLNKFHEFWKNNLCLTDPVDSATINKLPQIFDKYVVGSDQVWNLSLTNYDKHFFLDFCNKEKYSYAASLGGYDISSNDKSIFANYCKNFSFISVREQEGINLLKNILKENINIEEAIDPVFLHNRDFWCHQCLENFTANNYILLYMFKNKEKGIEIARTLSEKYNKKIIMIGSSAFKNKNGILYYRDAGPQEFLSLFNNADFVITDSFHGLAFSIIFEKQFLVFPYEGTSSRMKNLLKIAGLENRMYTSEDINIDVSIDFTLVKENMNFIIDKSKSIIINNILNS